MGNQEEGEDDLFYSDHQQCLKDLRDAICGTMDAKEFAGKNKKPGGKELGKVLETREGKNSQAPKGGRIQKGKPRPMPTLVKVGFEKRIEGKRKDKHREDEGFVGVTIMPAQTTQVATVIIKGQIRGGIKSGSRVLEKEDIVSGHVKGAGERESRQNCLSPK